MHDEFLFLFPFKEDIKVDFNKVSLSTNIFVFSLLAFYHMCICTIHKLNSVSWISSMCFIVVTP